MLIYNISFCKQFSMKIMKDIKQFKIKELKNFKETFDKLSEHIFDDKKVLIAVSGGPDSMFLSVLIYNFFIQNKLDLDNLFFVHCNHNTREETDSEQKFVEEFLTGLQVTSCKLQKVSQEQTESSLRQWRYGEFQKIIDQNHIDFIMTGHNLTDRIESSFMNMFRGAGLNWFLAMRFVDSNSLLQDVKIIRPLLDYTKKEVEEFCDKFKIPFVVDKTNLSAETSLRNKIRLELFPQFQKLSHREDSFFESMKKIYLEMEEKENIEDIWKLIEIRRSDYWNCDFAFLRNIPLSFVSSELLLKILKKFNLSSNISKNTLDELMDFFTSAKQGYKYINWIYFFLSHGKIYIIKAKKDFWEKYIEKSFIIDKLWECEIGKESVDIQDRKFIGLEIRYPKMGDKISSKSWSKYCINNKIPIFWRNFVPVIVDWKNILKHFYFW